MTQKCYLCTLFRLRKGIVWESKAFFLVFDSHPVSSGHMLIVTKKHIVAFDEIGETEWMELRRAIKQAVKIIETKNLVPVYKSLIEENETKRSVWFCKKALQRLMHKKSPNGYNHGFNDGKAAGRTVDHFHWHVIPRFDCDMKGVRGGIRFVIPKMGKYK